MRKEKVYPDAPWELPKKSGSDRARGSAKALRYNKTPYQLLLELKERGSWQANPGRIFGALVPPEVQATPDKAGAREGVGKSVKVGRDRAGDENPHGSGAAGEQKKKEKENSGENDDVACASAENRYFLTVILGGEPYKALFDPGAMLLLAGPRLSERFRDRLKKCDSAIRGVTGGVSRVAGVLDIAIEVGGRDFVGQSSE